MKQSSLKDKEELDSSVLLQRFRERRAGCWGRRIATRGNFERAAARPAAWSWACKQGLQRLRAALGCVREVR